MKILAAAAVLALALATSAHAFETVPPIRPGGGGPPPVAAPEIDPAGACAALTLLLGGLAVWRGGRNGR